VAAPSSRRDRARGVLLLSRGLQNAAKHAGPDATATIRLTEEGGRIGFTIEDDGVGFDPRTVERGAGLDNIADRVSAAGGMLRIDSARGRGTRVRGLLPA